MVARGRWCDDEDDGCLRCRVNLRSINQHSSYYGSARVERFACASGRYPTALSVAGHGGSFTHPDHLLAGPWHCMKGAHSRAHQASLSLSLSHTHTIPPVHFCMLCFGYARLAQFIICMSRGYTHHLYVATPLEQFLHAMIQPHQPSPSPSAAQSSKASSKWLWWQDLGLKHAFLETLRGRPRHSRMQVWLIRLSTSILLWTCFIQLMALAELWHPHLFKGWPPCFNKRHSAVIDTPTSTPKLLFSKVSAFPPPRLYKSNGYLIVSCNGGLNQMRAAICDMVAISRCLNLTLVVPELDKTSFWADTSDFKDIFDVDHFIVSLQNEVRIIKRLPQKYHKKFMKGDILSMPPISWSNESYYLSQILPIIKRHKVLHFSKTDTRLANNGLPVWMQKLRCRVNYEALSFTPVIETLGKELVNILSRKGPFLALHLRYEMDMLAFSGCTHGCTDAEAEQLTKMRFAYPWWKEKVIDSVQKRLDGLCPLTPEETALVLKALGFHRKTQIYIASGEIYGSERRMASLHAIFPKILRKEMLLSHEDLKRFQNHSSQMAALDYLVAINSDVFLPTYDGNMAKVVSGHRRYLGYRKTVHLDRQKLVGLLDQYKNGTLDWFLFALRVQEVEKELMGAPRQRMVIAERPKEEDYFYANPVECLY